MFLIFKKYVDKIKFVWIFQVSVVNIEIKKYFYFKSNKFIAYNPNPSLSQK